MANNNRDLTPEEVYSLMVSEFEEGRSLYNKGEPRPEDFFQQLGWDFNFSKAQEHSEILHRFYKASISA